MAKRSLSSNQSGEGDIRKNFIEADPVVEQAFYTTRILVCLWF